MNRFHRGFYAFMRTVIKPYFCITGYKWERYDPISENYLVLCNHNTNWDFFLYGLILKKHMYFVASEHIFRKGIVSWIIRKLADPIPRKKGAAGDDTVRMILERLRAGENVCMMAEGNRSFSGETGFISPRTAALVKESGVGLVNIGIHGCYFINPRWSKEKRKGPSWGSVVNEYTAQQLSEMSVEEVYEAIKRDLYVDAYADQRERMAKYRCKRPAENLESALFMCPECESASSMRSSKDLFRCEKCGYEVRYNDYGFFETTGSEQKLHFATVAEWYKWQITRLREKLSLLTDNGTGLFSDENIKISMVHPEKGTELLCAGRLVLYKDRLEVWNNTDSVSVMLADISKISITLTDTMLFTAKSGYYEVKPESGTYSALKYLAAVRLLQGKEYY